MTGPQPELVVDLAAIRHNVGRLRDWVGADAGGPQLMTVVKADGYGHGILEVARAARDAGTDWLGVATLTEALTLRHAGDTGPLLCWLHLPGEEFAAGIAADVEVTAYSTGQLAEIVAAADRAGRRARVQLKVDTGLSRGGATAAEWPALVAAARAAETVGSVEITGIWSHFACADEPGHPANDAQETAYRLALDTAHAAGLRPRLRHLANSAAAVLRPSARFDLVRCGIASYGLDPAPGHTPAELGLRPAMTATSPLALAKPVATGAGVSYGHAWTATADTTVGLVPVGYGDGVPRHASSVAEVLVAGKRRPIRGRVCMDQFVVDLGGDLPPAGTEVVLFGPGDQGEPTAQDWAEAVGTINYEITTRIGGRFARRHVDGGDR
ncbi:alanine racemase [Nocardioides limicola]|uniref:alanine racemase n=1 Tax=Nocardioides limicola TaxID=2803368 RepID=UPI00193C0A89|nr:alanine racemase [Nocardioides sp. DJM-14]